ncbi:transcription factor bHLH95 [Spinacia oleracea]|uniref:Transcription factor bHLH95 n=1 Tax=Spinacia oleracea TaxID=3562 RepID=A0A9R0JPK8_SPIOL|nr:transcription factor bHLH95 [Spinacia oleracea]
MSHENDALLWENQSWANLSNDTSGNSGGEKAVSLPEQPKEEKEKEKKRGRSALKKEKGVKGEKKKEGETSDHMHIWTERERRKKMRNMFSDLHALLPQLPPKADKSTIVDEAVNYIRTLESTLLRLQKQKLAETTTNPLLLLEPSVAASSRLAMFSSRETFMADQVYSINNNSKKVHTNTTFSTTASRLPVAIQTWGSNNVVLSICGDDAIFAIYAPKRHALFITICCVFDKYQIETISAHISSDVDRTHFMIRARVEDGAVDQLSELVTVEQIYKRAAAELVLWVN